jgi:type IV pilus assembly protein PilQ
MLKWLFKTQSAIFFAFCFLVVFQNQPVNAETAVAFEITDFSSEVTGETLTVKISGSTTPVYTVSERFSPFRFVVDIAGGRFANSPSLSAPALPANAFSKLTITDLKDQSPPVLRMEYTLADSHDYTVSKTEKSLQIKLFPAQANKSTSRSGKDLPSSQLSLQELRIAKESATTTISLLANTSIDKYKVGSLPGENGKKPRMYIDIDDVGSNQLPKEKTVGTAVEKIRVSSKGKAVRLVFDSVSESLFSYNVTPDPLGLKIVIDANSDAASPKMSKAPAESGGTASDDPLEALIGSSQKLVKTAPAQMTNTSAAAKATALTNDFSLSGYNKQRISVDFYKIDIHNVFRLFRQITDLNIIVDEEVQGALTLALNDVPWDFALDIILNLMDLKKEERFNTIVIYPAKKAFVWPNRTEDNLSFEADIEVIEQEALVIEKTAAQSKEIVEAKRFIADAQNFEERKEFEYAATAYTKALELWPQNTSVAARLASIYLVDLGVNAKAVFFAKQCLKNDPKHSQAALYAAIALANMQKIAEAKEYFAQSISGSPPLKEALFSYAVFSENNGQLEPAIKILEKYESHYGENVDTMVSKARIYDKQGLSREATKQYKALQASGFQLNPDLKKFIEGRMAAQDLQ